MKDKMREYKILIERLDEKVEKWKYIITILTVIILISITTANLFFMEAVFHITTLCLMYLCFSLGIFLGYIFSSDLVSSEVKDKNE